MSLEAAEISAQETYKEGMARNKTQLDSSVIYFEKAQQLFEEEQNHLGVGKCLSEIGRVYGRWGKIKQATTTLKQAISILETVDTIAATNEIGRCYNYWAYIYVKKRDNLDSARWCLKSGIEIMEKKSLENRSLAYAYHELGNVEHRFFNTEQSGFYLDKAASLYLASRDTQRHYIAQQDKGLLYWGTNKVDEAEQIFRTILDYPHLKAQRRAKTLGNLANLLLAKKELDEATNLIDEAIDLVEDTEEKEIWGLSCAIKAEIYKEKEQVNEAINWYQKAIAIIKPTKEGRNRNLIRFYTNLAHLHAKNKAWEIAQEMHQQSLQAGVDSFMPHTLQENPTFDQQLLKYIETRLIESLYEKGSTYYQKYMAQQQIADLETAVQTLQLTMQQIEFAKHELRSDKARLDFGEVVHEIYQLGLDATYQLYQLRQDHSYLQQAFQIIERNKSSVLRNAILAMEAKQNANIPDSLVQKEMFLKQLISFWDIQKKEHANKSANDSIIYFVSQLDSLKEKMKIAYPKYLEYQKNQLKTIDEIQTNLEDKTIVEYFLTDSFIYTLSITNQAITLRRIPNDDTFKQAVKQMYQAIKEPDLSEEGYDLYTQNAYFLYQQLLAPVVGNRKNPNNPLALIIIPDGSLSYLPFEALIRKMPAKDMKYNAAKYKSRNLRYLMTDCNISYAYSANLWYESFMQKTNVASPPTYDYIGFAPQFVSTPDSETMKGCTNEILPPFEFSEIVLDICKLFNGQAFLQQKANKNTFKTEGGKGRILHLYTHACVSDQNPMQNQIFFTDEATYSYELYGMQLNAEMAVLTACETGVGMPIRGEGMMSLARAFNYAGCPSVVTSLWEAQESTTQIITNNFYKNINEKYSKSQALRLAKIKFLQDGTNQTAHPAYWAAFVHIGNDLPLNHERSLKDKLTMFLMVCLGISFFFIALFLYYKLN